MPFKPNEVIQSALMRDAGISSVKAKHTKGNTDDWNSLKLKIED